MNEQIDSRRIITFLSENNRKTPAKLYINLAKKIKFSDCHVFGSKKSAVVFGDYFYLADLVSNNLDKIIDYHFELDRLNSAMPLVDYKEIKARIEPGAIIRDQVDIKPKAIIMMGAIINVGAVIGEETMIDMGAVVGGRAIIGKRCHIGANAVIAGVIEPPSAKPVIIEDDVVIGAGAVILEGVRVGRGSVIGANAVVNKDVLENVVVGGIPAKEIKLVDQKTLEKTQIISSLRDL